MGEQLRERIGAFRLPPRGSFRRQWEINFGDSLCRKIDAGLADCTAVAEVFVKRAWS